MSFPILIEPCNGQFAASLAGVPNVRVVQATRSQAIATLTAEIQRRIERGELVWLDVPVGGVTSLAGKYRDDPTWADICDEAYERRDAECQP